MNTDIIIEFCILGGALTIFIGVVICVTRRNITDQQTKREQEERLLIYNDVAFNLFNSKKALI